MSLKTFNEVISDIDDYINRCGGMYSKWYCGITSEPRQRLFDDHNVSESDGFWIYRNAGSEDSARRVERHFLNKGCKGGSGGGDYSSRYVYAYCVTNQTIE